MAEGAHLTSAVSHDKPSIFEVLAQESLVSTLRPAIKHAVRVLAEYRPEKFGWILRHFDEVYTVLDFTLQHYHLRKYCASFSEHFYNLCRVDPLESSRHLPTLTFWKSVICIVIIPYLKIKLDNQFEDLRHKYNTAHRHREFSLLSRIFITMYPYCHMAWEGAILTYQTAYMFDKSKYHSPLLHLSGVTLAVDLEEGSEDNPTASLPWQQLSIKHKAGFLLKKLVNTTAITLSTSLSVGVFFIQFLDWWYANDSNSASLTSLPVPDPPQRDDIGEEHTVCPICHRTRSNDTALSVSGYVFCYPCVFDYVAEYKMCPVTRYPARTDHLVKLYISNF